MSLFELQKLTKTFGGLKAVNGVDLTLERGEIVGLIGPNGAGKTTVFDMISGVLRPNSGKVLFKGEDITGLIPHSIVKKGLSRTFQLTSFFGEFTVLDNILIGLHLKADSSIQADLFNTTASRRKTAELRRKAEDIAAFMGLQAKLNEKARNLPHGYHKMLDMAIAIAAGPDLLLLDEPVAGMNALETNQMVAKIVEARNRGITILLVEHHMKIVMEICHLVYVLNFGEKIAMGTPQEISQNKDVIEAYLGSKYAVRS